jgi:hypothetical protein
MDSCRLQGTVPWSVNNDSGVACIASKRSWGRRLRQVICVPALGRMWERERLMPTLSFLCTSHAGSPISCQEYLLKKKSHAKNIRWISWICMFVFLGATIIKVYQKIKTSSKILLLFMRWNSENCCIIFWTSMNKGVHGFCSLNQGQEECTVEWN